MQHTHLGAEPAQPTDSSLLTPPRLIIGFSLVDAPHRQGTE
jgi:hypothetical protein